MTISASNSITIQNILFGDVWLCSGQSNMEMPMAGFGTAAQVQNSAEEIARADHPEIRLLRLER